MSKKGYLFLVLILVSGCATTRSPVARRSDDYFVRMAADLNSALNTHINHVEYDFFWDELEKQAQEEDRFRQADAQRATRQAYWQQVALALSAGVNNYYQTQLDMAQIRAANRVRQPAYAQPGYSRPTSLAFANDACHCMGYAGPGGPCYAGPGGPSYDGPGGPAYDGPGGPCYSGPGGPCYSGPGGGDQCPSVCR